MIDILWALSWALSIGWGVYFWIRFRRAEQLLYRMAEILSRAGPEFDRKLKDGTTQVVWSERWYDIDEIPAEELEGIERQ